MTCNVGFYDKLNIFHAAVVLQVIHASLDIRFSCKSLNISAPLLCKSGFRG